MKTESLKTEGDCDTLTDLTERSFYSKKKSLIPKPSAGKKYKERSEKFCKIEKIGFPLLEFKQYVELGTCTSIQNAVKRDSHTNTVTINCQDKDYKKWMKDLQFPDTFQSLFLSEKGLKKFQVIIQDQINMLSNTDKCKLPPISHYQIITKKALSDTDMYKAKNKNITNSPGLFQCEQEISVTNPDQESKITHRKGVLQVDEIKKDLITVCAYIFKQTRIINELWKYLEHSTGSKCQLNSIKNITTGALNQHLNKLHTIRENLYRFNEKYRVDLDKRIHLLKQISNYYKAEGKQDN